MSNIDPFEMPLDGRQWNHYWQQVVATVTVDTILEKVFQGKKDDLREQMLNVAAKQCRRIEWGPPLDIEKAHQEAILRAARKVLAEERRSVDGPQPQ